MSARSNASRFEQSGLSRHIISFYWDDFNPYLIYYDQESRTLEEYDLEGSISVAIGAERRCTGFEDDAGYHPCPWDRKVTSFSTCRSCASTWLPDQRCVFEPRCKGDLCDHPEFCSRNHVVYLAFFGTLMKVGMTSEKRLRERAIEQGADAISPIYRCDGRLQARQLEREISRRFRINQQFRAKRILGQLKRVVAWERIEAKYRSTLIRLSMWKDPIEAPLIHLDEYPIDEIPPTPPEPIDTEGIHAGRILGIKGKFLLYRADNGECHALDLSDVPSRSLRTMPRPRDEV